VFLCLIFAPPRFPYNRIHTCQLKSVSTDDKTLNNLVGDKNFGSIRSDDGRAKPLERCFASPSNEGSLQVVVVWRHLEGLDVGLCSRTRLLFETGKVLVKGMWVTKITTNESNLRGTSAAATGEVGIAELVVIRRYQTA
jgi:hypothetical protein